MKLLLRDARLPKEGMKGWRMSSVNVRQETHDKVKAVARRAGYTQTEMADRLINYALENIEWE